MMRPTRDAIQSYMSITGASDSLAIQRLEEHGNNLPEAINAHFRDVERSIYDDTSLDSRSEYNVVQDNNQVRGIESRPVPSALPSILSAARNFRPSLLLDSNYRRNILRQLSGSALSGNPSPSSRTGEVTGFPAHSSWGNDQVHPPRPADDYARHSPSYEFHIPGGTHRDADSPLNSNDAEEEMIKAAIEASKKDFQEGRHNARYSLDNDPSRLLSPRNDQAHPSRLADAYARDSPSYGSQVPGGTHRDPDSPHNSNDEEEEEMIRAAIEASKKDFQEGRHNARYSLDNDPSRVLSTREVINREDEDIARAISMSLKVEEQENLFRDQLAEFMPHSMEHHNPSQSSTNPRSSALQDKREEMKQKQPVDTRSQHGHDFQNIRTSYPEEEPVRSSTTKKTAVPIEPSADNEDAITLLVKMPDSSRHGRRFLKSDKLKYLFDFIDAAGLVKPGTYRMVRAYPRRAFSLEDGALTFEELSLTNKQEALFLELLI